VQEQPGGCSLVAHVRQQLAERGDRRVAAGVVDRPHAPQVAREVAARHAGAEPLPRALGAIPETIVVGPPIAAGR
jgi:hypothetical protein